LNNCSQGSIPLDQFSLWEKTKEKRIPFSFELDITARCNNDCRHCYINLPAGDRKAKGRELSLVEIKEIVDKAVSLGALWCLITGGEPLLREDFPAVYLYMKKRGLLISVFTNATLITQEYVSLFQKYPPRDIEVTVYGVTQETYERVSRRAGSFAAFMRGLDLLLESGVKVRLKAMALKSNLHEMTEIARFCRANTKDYFRLDPFLHLRYDGDQKRNEEIKSERVSPEDITALEASDPERFEALRESCGRLIDTNSGYRDCNHLFHCGAGNDNFNISYDGLFRLCASLWHPDCVYDLKKGNLKEAWQTFIPQVREMRSKRREFLDECLGCSIVNLCMWCPAYAHLETGAMDSPVDYFCRVAHARTELFGNSVPLVPTEEGVGLRPQACRARKGEYGKDEKDLAET
jgi:radical SAM protein with 4Fe4S-binding SPASM domain